MLEFHLDSETSLASRPEGQIDDIVEWLDQQLGLRSKAVCDLGCGPGLYSSRFAASGADVTGVDVSEVSLTYARQQAAESGQAIRYIQADYCEDSLPGGFDVVTLIYYDYCALSPARRRALLARAREMLVPGGRLVLDVLGAGALAQLTESTTVEPSLMGGFWSDQEYVGLERVWLYAAEQVCLNRYLIVEPDSAFEIFNWLQFFTEDSLARELDEAGFEIQQFSASLKGESIATDPETIAVIAMTPT